MNHLKRSELEQNIVIPINSSKVLNISSYDGFLGVNVEDVAVESFSGNAQIRANLFGSNPNATEPSNLTQALDLQEFIPGSDAGIQLVIGDFLLNSFLEAIYQQELMHFLLPGDASFMSPFIFLP